MKPGPRPTEPAYTADLDALTNVLDRRKHADLRLEALLVVLAHGLRKGELCALVVGDVCEMQGASVLHCRTLKQRGDMVVKRVVPIKSQEDVDVIEKFIKTAHGDNPDPTAPLFMTTGERFPFRRGRMTARAVDYHLAVLKRRAGVTKRLTAHSFRHCVATELLQHGADLKTVQALLGHASLSSTERYLHTTLELKITAMEALNHG